MVITNSVTEDAVKNYFAALPGVGENPVGNTARSVLVNRLKGATPGRATTPYLGVQGELFIKIFFPGYSAVPFESNVGSVTSLGDDFWNGMSIAVICQAMYNLTSDLRSQLMIDNIRNAINSYMSQIQNAALPWYSFMANQVDNTIKSTYSAIPADQHGQALQQYLDALKNPAWINAKEAQYQSGTWTNADWEMYHHWIKLTLLGASADTVNDTIAYLLSQGLPIPDEVRSGRWETYFRWFGNAIDWQDIKNDASNGILKEECYVYPGAMFPSCMKESNSFEFTANSQPGNCYRHVPSSSCFRAGTKVLMGDLTCKPIEQVQVGDTVMTPNGASSVLLISTPLLAGRTLYSFEGINFEFTDTHPFLLYHAPNADEIPAFTCINPLELIENVPIISQDGIVPLKQGVELCRYTDGASVPIPAPAISSEKTEADDELLYDLILDMKNGMSAYYVGDGTVQIGIASEIPQYVVVPETSCAVLLMLDACYQTILDTLKNVSEQDFLDVLTVGLNSMATNLIPTVMEEIQTQQVPNDIQYEIGNLTGMANDMVRQMFENFAVPEENGNNLSLTADYNQNSRFGNLYNTLAMTFGMPFVMSLDLGWRSMRYIEPMSATVLSVSPGTVEMFGQDIAGLPEIKSVRIILRRDKSAFVTELPCIKPAGSNGYLLIFDQCSYFDMWRYDSNPDALPWQIGFYLMADGEEYVCRCENMVIPQQINAGSSMFKALIYDLKGNVCGRIYFDIRIINEELLAAEQEARKSWSAGDKQALAQQLGKGAGNFINANFASAVNVFGQISCTNTKNYFSAINYEK